jgi:hypothetical protein
MSHDVSMLLVHPFLVPLLKALALATGLGGLAGLGWSVLGTPALARGVRLLRGGRQVGLAAGPVSSAEISSGSLSMEIFIAAFNEEKVVGATLDSVVASIRELQASGVAVQALIRVGLDHCTDATSDLVEQASLAIRTSAPGAGGIEIRGEANPGPRARRAEAAGRGTRRVGPASAALRFASIPCPAASPTVPSPAIRSTRSSSRCSTR